jgi:hypothetical protein
LAKVETIAYDSSNADLGRSRPASIRPSTAWVSRNAASGGTAGLTGPWTVTTERGPMNWSSST